MPFSFRSRRDSEWIGGRYALPTSVREGDAILQPFVDLWMEMPAQVIVGMKMIDPRAPAPFAEGLEEAMASPAEGSPRRPSRVRVPDAGLAEALRASIGTPIEIRVAPVPELDEVVESLADHLETAGEEPSYLGDGEIPLAVIGSLFAAAEKLFRMAPWKQVADDQVLRVDISAFGIDGAVLCVIGGGGQDFGLLLFRSIEDYEQFSTRIADGIDRLASPPDVVAQWALLSLSYNRKRDLPPRMQREIERQHWPVAGSKAYPVLMAIAPDATPRYFGERDYRIMTACTLAFLDFFSRHRGMFEEESPETTRESFAAEGGPSVTLTAPYGRPPSFSFSARDLLLGPAESGVVLPREQHRSVGRNDPCPCGSGKKYKKCHLDADRAREAAGPEGESVHDMDRRLVQGIGRFGIDRYGEHWLEELERGFGNDEAVLQILIPWVGWTADVDGKRIAESFLQQNGSRLSSEERDWFQAQLAAWLSLWEVTHVEPGRIDVRDLLTGERRSVREMMGSKIVVARDTMLARVVDFRGTSYFGGMYGRTLPPVDAGGVLDVIRRKLRIRKGAVPIERLRDAIVGGQMIHFWTGAVADFDERRSKPPVLTNTDGELLVFVTDSFSFEPKKRPQIERRVEAMDGVDDVSKEDGETVIVFVRPGNRMHKSWENTVLGRVFVAAAGLRIETNSEARADALRRRVRDACAGLLGEGTRSTESASEVMRQPAPPREPRPPEPYELEALRAAKEAHYRDWLDTPIPLLAGKTPRAAARSRRSREQLDVLLRDIENREARLPEAERFDVGRIRAELAIDE